MKKTKNRKNSEKLEIVKYAHGFQEAATKFQTTTSSIYSWKRHNDNGLFFGRLGTTTIRKAPYKRGETKARAAEDDHNKHQQLHLKAARSPELSLGPDAFLLARIRDLESQNRELDEKNQQLGALLKAYL